MNELERLNSELHSIRVRISGLHVRKSTLDAISEKMKEKIIRLESLNEKSESDNHGVQEKVELGSISGRLESLSNAKSRSENCQNTIAIYQNDNVEKRYLDSLSIAQSKEKTVEQLESVQKTVAELDIEIEGIQNGIPELKSSYKLKNREIEKTTTNRIRKIGCRRSIVHGKTGRLSGKEFYCQRYGGTHSGNGKED